MSSESYVIDRYIYAHRGPVEHYFLQLPVKLTLRMMDGLGIRKFAWHYLPCRFFLCRHAQICRR